jgi:hypothetical protein
MVIIVSMFGLFNRNEPVKHTLFFETFQITTKGKLATEEKEYMRTLYKSKRIGEEGKYLRAQMYLMSRGHTMIMDETFHYPRLILPYNEPVRVNIIRQIMNLF